MMRRLLLILLALVLPKLALAACPTGSGVTCTQYPVTTNAALKALTAGASAYIYRQGYYAPGDGGDAIYAWSATSTCTDDGGSCIVPASAPSSGRWILNNNGAVSVKIFGAHCDGTVADETANFSAALAARTAVYIPANTTCYIAMTSPSSGLVLNDGNRLFGENQFTSQIFVCDSVACPGLGLAPFSGNYNFVAGKRFGPGLPFCNDTATTCGTGIVVASNVGTVTTWWSHSLWPGDTVIIGGSATAALNRTYTVQTVPTPNTFTITTVGVANGTYIDPTSVSAQSAIGTDIIRSSCRESGCSIKGELDHIHIYDNSALNTTLIDMITMVSFTVHDIYFVTPGPATATHQSKVAITCADLSPGGLQQECYFNNLYNFNGPVDTFLHLSSVYGNSGVNSIHQVESFSRIAIDTTGTTNQAGGSDHTTFSDWYIVFPGSTANTYDFFTGGYYPALNSTFINVNFEGNTNGCCLFPGTISFLAATSGQGIALQGQVTVQSLATALTDVDTTHTVDAGDGTIICRFPGVTIPLPSTPSAGQLITLGAQPTGACTISGNGNTIHGYGTTLVLHQGQTATLQWSTQDNDWEVIAAPTNQLLITTVSALPTCAAATTGMMYGVTDAALVGGGAPQWNQGIQSGGSAKIPVYCNGSAWTAH